MGEQFLSGFLWSLRRLGLQVRLAPGVFFRLVRAPSRHALHAALGKSVRNEERIDNFEVEVQRQDGGTLLVPWRGVNFLAWESERILDGSGGWGPEGQWTEQLVLTVFPSDQVAQSNQPKIQAPPPTLENSPPPVDAPEVLEVQADIPLGLVRYAEEAWTLMFGLWGCQTGWLACAYP
jgi:hypothetical protein